MEYNTDSFNLTVFLQTPVTNPITKHVIIKRFYIYVYLYIINTKLQVPTTYKLQRRPNENKHKPLMKEKV